MGNCVPVYVIDDDPAMLESMQFLLASLGIDSRTFPDAPSFLKEAGELGPGCVLTDFRMPAMTGLGLHTALRNKGVAWPVILMSGNCDYLAIRSHVTEGLVDLLEKPFSVERLVEVLNAAVAKLAI
jgi:two-component system response regulator FixJ